MSNRITSFFQSWSAGQSDNKDADFGYPANAGNTKSNPIFKSVEDLNRNFKVYQVDGIEYVSFGVNNDIPEVLDKLSLQSPTHRGILDKKSKLIVGNGCEMPEGPARFKAVFQNINGEDYHFNRVFSEAAYSYEKYGAVPYVVKLDNAGKMIGLRVAKVRSVRAGLPNERFEIPYWVEKRSFKHSHTRLNERAKRIATYKAGSKSGEFMLYVMNPASDNPFYGLPSYVSAYYYITGDFEFGKHIDNAVKNGFSPSVMLTYVGRQMTEEQKGKTNSRFASMFTGADGLKYMINFVRNKEEMPQVNAIEAKNLDKTIATMSELNDAKILTAHSVTSPTLFGIQVAGKLGGTGAELLTAYYTFRASETLPNRDTILDPICTLMKKHYGISNIEVAEEPIEAIIPNIIPVISPNNKGEQAQYPEPKEEADGSEY